MLCIADKTRARPAPMSGNEIETLFRTEAGRVLSTLIRLLGDFERAEEALQDAVAAALEQWPSRGIPENPRAWLVHVGRNTSIDRLRRQIVLRSKQQDLETALAQAEASASPDEAEEDFGDDMLR